MASVSRTVWCLHCAGWTVPEIDEALHIGHARSEIARWWSLDVEKPEPDEMARALASTMEQRDEKEKIG